MTERDDLEKRIESEGVDPKGTSQLTDVAQYGDVLVTLWHQPASPEGIASYIVKLDHSVNFKPDGKPLEASHRMDANNGLRWAMEHLEFLFVVSQLFGASTEEA